MKYNIGASPASSSGPYVPQRRDQGNLEVRNARQPITTIARLVVNFLNVYAL